MTPTAQGFRHNLGVALRARFERDGSAPDLDRAIGLVEDAVAATDPNHPNRAMYLSGLGLYLRARFELSGSSDDLNQAVDVAEEAVAATPANHPHRGLFLLNLCLALHDRYDRAGRTDDYRRAVDVAREGAEMRTASPDVRTREAWVWGRLAVRAREWDVAVEAYESGIRLAALMTPRSLPRADQEHWLSELRGLGREAAAAALEAGRAETAVELLEAAQAVLFSQVLDARSDLTDLQAAHPEVAERFERLRDELDRPTPFEPLPSDDPEVVAFVAAQLDADRRREAGELLDELIVEIRMLDGFGRFLLPRLAADLRPAAVGGPVVLINVSELRSDAIVLTEAGLEVVPLPDASPGAVGEQVVTFMSALGPAAEPRGIVFAPEIAAEAAGLTEVLAWLWDSVTGPVLEHLGLTTRPADDARWPRVWWCPAGPLAMLPMHAAGRHETSDDDQPQTVIDLVISSSTPTMHALLHRRRPPPDPSRARLMVVAMPETPGQPDLPGARCEAELLGALLPGHVDVLGLPGTPAARRR